MGTQDIISVQQFCQHYAIPVTFIYALNEYELVEIIYIDEIKCICKTEIKEIEKMIRLHYELNIDLEAIDVVYNLLKQVESLQDEIMDLTNRLKFYEEI